MFFLAFITGLTVIYANMVGPSSAIVIIPLLDWYPVTTPYNGQTVTAFMSAEPSLIFVDQLNGTQNENCTDILNDGQSSIFVCPAGGNPALLEWTSAFNSEDSGLQINMAEPLGKTRRILLSNVTTKSDSESSLAIAATHYSAVNSLLGLYWRYVQRQNIGLMSRSARPRFSTSDTDPIFSPLLQVECGPPVKNPPKLYFPHDSLHLFDEDTPQNKKLIVPAGAWQNLTDVNSTAVSIEWYAYDEILGEGAGPNDAYYRGSFGAVLTIPTEEDDGQGGFAGPQSRAMSH